MEPKNFARLLRSLRRQAKITQNALGDRIGVTKLTVHRWENAHSFPAMSKLIPLAQFFNRPANEFMYARKLYKIQKRNELIGRCKDPVVSTVEISSEQMYGRSEKYHFQVTRHLTNSK